MTCRDALQREAELREEQQQEADNAKAKKVEEQQDEARAAFHVERARQRAGLAIGIVIVMGILFLIPLAFTTDPLYRWTAIGFAVFLVGCGIAGIGQYRKQTDGTQSNLMSDMASGVGLLLGRRQVLAERLLLVVLLLVPFVCWGLGAMMGVTPLGGLGIGVALDIALGVVFRRHMQANECPHCWTQGSAVFDGVVDLGTVAVTTRTVEKSTVHEGLNTFGLPIATIKTPVERTRLVRRQAQNWHCTACGHRWRK